MKNTKNINIAKFKVGDPIIFHDWLGVVRDITEEHNTYTKHTFFCYKIDWITTGDKKQDIYSEDYGFHENDIDKWHRKYRDRILKKDRVQEIV